MNKTLLLCFIHGFKGNDNTFGDFPEHLQALLSHALPKITVAAIRYPAFETRGDLHECVSRFREWLQNKVIDLEVANGTPSPTVDPSVHTVLVGHSMGGIVAADAILSLAAEKPVSGAEEDDDQDGNDDDSSAFMFPFIRGLLAFDTPFLGIAPSVVAHGAQSHWSTASAAYTAYTNVAGAFGWGAGGNASSSSSSSNPSKAGPDAAKMLPAPSSSESTSAAAGAAAAANAAPSSSSASPWQAWGRYAMLAGAAGAVAAGAGAAYANREAISEGWAWAGSHLEFVGCLARAEELRRRVAAVVGLEKSRGLGFADLYICLGKGVGMDFGGGARKGESVAASKMQQGQRQGQQQQLEQVDGERTFVAVPGPRSDWRRFWHRTVNDLASAEVTAHMSMFSARTNPGYYAMSELAKELVVGWVMESKGGRWYEDAGGEVGRGQQQEEEAAGG